MVSGRIHVVGAGLAGLSAALAATARGAAVALHEAGPVAGGRCRTVRGADGFDHDNGTHVLFTANRRALALVARIGARGEWIEPEPDGLPVWDADAQRLFRIGLSIASWLRRDRRPADLSAVGLARLARLALSPSDRPVGEVMGRDPLARSFVGPLAVAVLNTPLGEASSRRFGAALRQLAWPGAGRLMVARRGLDADLVAPALALLRSEGVAARFGTRLRTVTQEGGRATTLVFGDRTVALRANDRVILALPPSEIARLLPGVPVPDAFEPIVNLHFRLPGTSRPRFVGLLGTLAQWALLRENHCSVTISAARQAVKEDADLLAPKIWREVAPALAALGVLADASRVPEARVVKERRATIRQAAGPQPQPPLRPLANLALAGDWLGALPATIESAVAAGERAVEVLLEPRPAGRSWDLAAVEAGGLP